MTFYLAKINLTLKVLSAILLYPRHTKYAQGVYSFHWFRPSIRLSVLPSYPSVRTYARYIGRLEFVLVSGLFCHCGVKNCVVGLTNR